MGSNGYKEWIWTFIIAFFLFKSCSNNTPKYNLVWVNARPPYPEWGICDCPYDYDIRGYECGDRSAYVRSGGQEPVCRIQVKVRAKR